MLSQVLQIFCATKQGVLIFETETRNFKALKHLEQAVFENSGNFNLI